MDRAGDPPEHLVVVDDDPKLRALLAQYLSQSGYKVTTAADGRGLDRILDTRLVDLIVLDLMLPGEDGLAICRRLRAERLTPIIMLTARGEEVDRIVGLELGADDYLAKPFNPRELLARVRNVLKRNASSSAGPSLEGVRAFEFDGWRLDLMTRALVGPNDEPVSLTGAEYRLLLVLLSHANKVLSRNRLMELLRGRDAERFDRSIDVRVSRLRSLLGDPAREPRIVKTVYGEGYVIGVPVTRK
jgi:two-component system, OmpR family, response regulator